jgi:hypothetical protein
MPVLNLSRRTVYNFTRVHMNLFASQMTHTITSHNNDLYSWSTLYHIRAAATSLSVTHKKKVIWRKLWTRQRIKFLSNTVNNTPVIGNIPRLHSRYVAIMADRILKSTVVAAPCSQVMAMCSIMVMLLEHTILLPDISSWSMENMKIVSKRKAKYDAHCITITRRTYTKSTTK